MVATQLILTPIESSAVYCAIRALHLVNGRVDLTLAEGDFFTKVFEYSDGSIRVWRSQGDRSFCESYASHLQFAATYGIDPTLPFQEPMRSL